VINEAESDDRNTTALATSWDINIAWRNAVNANFRHNIE
jgi:hypothetical protein